ncbi:MAG: hypothetical protein V6Z89_11530 [Desulfobacter sp.]
MQTLVLFIHRHAGLAGERFKQEICGRFPFSKTVIFQTAQSMESWLRGKGTVIFDQRLIVLFADTRDRLGRLDSMAHLFEGERVIVLLPDRQKETIGCVHRFRPRYFSFSQGPYDDVCDVLAKMIQW